LSWVKYKQENLGEKKKLGIKNTTKLLGRRNVKGLGKVGGGAEGSTTVKSASPRQLGGPEGKTHLGLAEKQKKKGEAKVSPGKKNANRSKTGK